MTRKETVDKMVKIIMEAITETSNTAAPANYYEATIEAETLYDNGFRKTFTSEFATNEQNAYKEGYRKGIDTAVKRLAEYAQEIVDEGTYDGIGAQDILEFAEHFEVE